MALRLSPSHHLSKEHGTMRAASSPCGDQTFLTHLVVVALVASCGFSMRRSRDNGAPLLDRFSQRDNVASRHL